MGFFTEMNDRYFWRAVLAEFFATAFFIFNVTLVLTESVNFGSAPIIIISFAIGMSVAVLAQTFGPICGAHLNPAVTIGLLVKGDLSVFKSLLYIIVQLIGAILGSAVTYAIVPAKRRGALGTLALNAELEEVQGLFIELILTILLVLTVFASTSSDHSRKNFGFANCFAIGMSVTVAHLIGIPLTGSGINPARAFGPAVVIGNFDASHWVYWIGPLLGAVIAGLFYRFVLSVEPPRVEKTAQTPVKDHYEGSNVVIEFNNVATAQP